MAPDVVGHEGHRNWQNDEASSPMLRGDTRAVDGGSPGKIRRNHCTNIGISKVAFWE